MDREYLFRSYYYRSGATQTMRDHLKGVVEDVMKRVELKDGDCVVDIGSNDGTLLSFYPWSVHKFGFEPSDIPLIEHDFGRGGIIRDFYPGSNPPSGEAKVITALAMFYDLDDPNKFLQDIKKELRPDGLLVLQVNYLPDTLRNNAVGDICHEHLCYYSGWVLRELLYKNGFAVEDASMNTINGGSIRMFVRHTEAKPKIKWWPVEEYLSLGSELPYREFTNRISTIARKTREYIETLRKLGKTVSVIGASTRGATFLQYAGLNRYGILIDCVERDPSKVGKHYLGMPIISEDEDKATPSDWYLLAMPWLEKEVRERMPWVKRLILPLPEPRIVVDGTETPL